MLTLCFDDTPNAREAALESVLQCNKHSKNPVHAIALSSTSQVERIAIFECKSDCKSIQFRNGHGLEQSSDKECLIPPAVDKKSIFGIISIALNKQGDTTPPENVNIEGRVRVIWRHCQSREVDERYSIVLRPN